MDDTSNAPKPIDYNWPQPKLADDFPNWKEKENVQPNAAANKLVQGKGGAEDKGDGADHDTHVEHYPDKAAAKEASEAKHSSV